jgi:hypothetical protein
MNIKIDYIETKETLELYGNRFFTQEQLDEIRRA